MTTYIGIRAFGESTVLVQRHIYARRLPLEPRTALRLYSHGFSWGRACAGGKQLALAILADHLDDDREALALCEGFAACVITRLPASQFMLTCEQIDEWVALLRDDPAGLTA
jgi:hypothetical protein